MRISSKALHQLIREEIKQLREETDEEWARPLGDLAPGMSRAERDRREDSEFNKFFLSLDDQRMEAFMKQVGRTPLTIALMAVDDATKSRFYDSISPRGQEYLEDDQEAMKGRDGRDTDPEDIRRHQQDILELARDMFGDDSSAPDDDEPIELDLDVDPAEPDPEEIELDPGAPNPEELELDPDETAPTAEPVEGPDPRLADTTPGGFPPVAGPDPEGDPAAAAEPLQKATNVKDFFYSFGDLARKSLGDDIETQATIITDLHRARKGLQALAYTEPLFGDGDTVNVDPQDLSKILSKVYDFGLGPAAAPFKLNLAKLVDKAVQRQKDAAKDKEFYQPTGDSEPGMSSPRGSSSGAAARPTSSTSGASDWITESKDLSSANTASFKRFKKLAGIK